MGKYKRVFEMARTWPIDPHLIRCRRMLYTHNIPSTSNRDELMLLIGADAMVEALADMVIKPKPGVAQSIGQSDNIMTCPRGHGDLLVQDDWAECVICGFESHQGKVIRGGKAVKMDMIPKTPRAKFRYPEDVKRESVRRVEAGESRSKIRREIGCASHTLEYWIDQYGRGMR